MYTQEEGGWAVQLKYETCLNIKDVPALRAEAMDIWQSFRADADKSGLRIAALSANEPPRNSLLGSLLTTNESYGFVFLKGADGEWAPLPDR
jgi:hypothetical protein